MSDQNHTPILSGSRIYLREVRLSDVNDRYHRWINDPEVTRYTESRFFSNSMEHLQNYVDEIINKKDLIFLAVILKENKQHIGNIKLGPIDWIHRNADIGVIIGEKDYGEKDMQQKQLPYCGITPL